MWILNGNAVSDEQQDSIQQNKNRFRSGGVVLQKFLIRTYKQIDCI